MNIVDQDQARQLFALRRILEDFAGEEAVKHASSTQIERLKYIAHQMRRGSVDNGDQSTLSPRFVSANIEFHALIVAASGNRYLARLYSKIQMHVQIVTYLITRGPDPRADAVRRTDHEAIARAVAARDVNRLKTALRAHAEGTSRIVLRNLSVNTD